MKLKSTIAVLAAMAFAAAADTPAQAKAAIEKQMGGYVAALKARDVKKVEAIIRANFAPDFKDIGMDGQARTLDDTVAQMKMNVSMLKSVKSASLAIKSVKVAGNTATTVEAFKLDAVIAIPNDPKPHTLKVDSIWSGSYAKKNGRWWCLSSKTTKESVSVDGKKGQ
jgi:hypothetical protein